MEVSYTLFCFMQIIGRDCVYYFHDMIVEMIKWGFQEGKTLFGFGYDFRQSNRYVLNQPAISNTAIITKFLAPNRFFFLNGVGFTMYGAFLFLLLFMI